MHRVETHVVDYTRFNRHLAALWSPTLTDNDPSYPKQVRFGVSRVSIINTCMCISRIHVRVKSISIDRGTRVASSRVNISILSPAVCSGCSVRNCSKEDSSERRHRERERAERAAARSVIRCRRRSRHHAHYCSPPLRPPPPTTQHPLLPFYAVHGGVAVDYLYLSLSRLPTPHVNHGVCSAPPTAANALFVPAQRGGHIITNTRSPPSLDP